MPPDERSGPHASTGRRQPPQATTATITDGADDARRCDQCGGPLAPKRRRFCSDLCRVRGQRAERVTETGEFGAAAVRMIRAMARRVGASDIAEFGAMWEVMTEAEHAVTEAIDHLRAVGFSWAEIAAEIGWSKQRLWQWRQRRGEFPRQQSVYTGSAESGVAG
jgi:hypothetical protein